MFFIHPNARSQAQRELFSCVNFQWRGLLSPVEICLRELISVSGHLSTYPSPNTTLTPTYELTYYNLLSQNNILPIISHDQALSSSAKGEREGEKEKENERNFAPFFRKRRSTLVELQLSYQCDVEEPMHCSKRVGDIVAAVVVFLYQHGQMRPQIRPAVKYRRYLGRLAINKRRTPDTRTMT